MKVVLNPLLFVVLMIGASHAVLGQGPGRNGATGGTTAASTGGQTSVSTLFALDPLAQSICFRDGGPGSVFQNGQTRNRCSDLNFHSYTPNSFRVGTEGSREGVIIDLGTAEDLKARYGFTETVGHGQGFASISVKNGKAMILKDYETNTLRELNESGNLFNANPRQANVAQVKPGHIYLLRITDRNDKAFELFAKVLVLAHVPNESVTIRWQVIENIDVARTKTEWKK